MSGRTPGSGRKPGTKNKATKDLEAVLEEHVPGFNPLVWLQIVGRDGRIPPSPQELIENPNATGRPVDEQTQIKCNQIVAEYRFPKRKAVEAQLDVDGKIELSWMDGDQ